ncbi:MAG: hypothetical protein KA267_06095 [Gemmatimonadales bacterium]|nr:hypothetical protein [Gemmatimonadales bacterium]
MAKVSKTETEKAKTRKPAGKTAAPWQKTTPRKVGRPTVMTEATCTTILVRLAAGESMIRICKDPDMPGEVTVYRHIFNNEAFRQAYEQAREIQAERAVDEMIEIADDGKNDWMEKTNSDGASLGWVINGEHVQRSRLRIDTRKWTAMKLRPKKYGDRIDHNLGGQADNPLIALVQAVQGSAMPIGAGPVGASVAPAAEAPVTLPDAPSTTAAQAPRLEQQDGPISPFLRPQGDI